MNNFWRVDLQVTLRKGRDIVCSFFVNAVIVITAQETESNFLCKSVVDPCWSRLFRVNDEVDPEIQKRREGGRDV